MTSLIISALERYIEDDKGWNIAKKLKRFAQANLFRGEYMAHDEEIEEVTSDSKYMGRLHHALRSALRSYKRQFDEKLEDCIARIEPEVEAVAGVSKKKPIAFEHTRKTCAGMYSTNRQKPLCP